MSFETSQSVTDTPGQPEIFDASLRASIDTLEGDTASREVMQEVTSSIDLKESFFEDEANILLFKAVAKEVSNGELSERDHEFYATAMTVIARDHSDVLGTEFYKGINNLSVRSKAELYERFTNKQMSERLMSEIFDKGVIDKTIARLKPNGEPLEDIAVTVLNIANENNTIGFIHPDWDDHETRGDIERWKADLLNNSAALDRAIGDESMPATLAWMETVEGKKTFFISLPDAEKGLDKVIMDELNSDDEHTRLVSLVAHEFTHTQGGVNDDAYVGIGLEELRAEEYSGNRGGYRDAKLFAKALGDVTGVDVTQLFEGGNGGTKTGLYEKIFAAYGTKLGLEVIMARPQAYKNNETSGVVKNMDAALGSYSEIIEREVMRKISDDTEKEKIVMRMADRRKRLIKAGVSNYIIDGIYSESENPAVRELWDVSKDMV